MDDETAGAATDDEAVPLAGAGAASTELHNRRKSDMVVNAVALRAAQRAAKAQRKRLRAADPLRKTKASALAAKARAPTDEETMRLALAKQEKELAALNAKWAAEEKDLGKQLNLRDHRDDPGYVGRNLLRVGGKASSAQGASATLWSAALNGDGATVQYLLDVRGVPVESRNQWGQTALHCAAEGGRQPVVALLLSRGARVHAIDYNACTALHLAAQYAHPGCAAELLRYGCPLDRRDKFGHTALDTAREEAGTGPSGGGEPMHATDPVRKDPPLCVASLSDPCCSSASKTSSSSD